MPTAKHSSILLCFFTAEFMLCCSQVCTDAALAVALASAAEPAPNAARPTPTRAARAVAMQFGKVQSQAVPQFCTQACLMLLYTSCAPASMQALASCTPSSEVTAGVYSRDDRLLDLLLYWSELVY
jgi:hypothetical protein